MPDQEHFLVNVDLSTVPLFRTRCLVIGSGVAGLSAALAAAGRGQVVLTSKSGAMESNTTYAQGGVATALADDDTADLHMDDTLRAGGGLCDPEAVRLLAEEGRERCQELIGMGVEFDRVDGKIAFTREGAHSRRRVIHADGDATGRAMSRGLLEAARHSPDIHLLEHHFAIDLLHGDGVCHGALFLDTRYGRYIRVEADFTIVASGGMGQVFRETTNPAIATADGYAMCFRAGAEMRDMEFMQFHPTTLYLAGAPRFLISEAVRGEGAFLVNQAGERFMARYSEKEELSSRDVVSQSIFKELAATGDTCVYLDLRHLDPELVSRRFPTIMAVCADYGIDIRKDLVPVRPAAHYMMGGVATDLNAATTVRNLYAAGEVAFTGVHGANRLASNSLLEGLVFGHRAGLAEPASAGTRPHTKRIRKRLPAHGTRLDIDDISRSLKALTWRHLGAYRDAVRLAETVETLKAWSRYVLAEEFHMRPGFEIQNMLTTARIMAELALRRTESRGAHQRIDYPETSPDWARHSRLALGDLEG
ncbi:MAG: L-aspartate oxidase [Planctomycetota bacterium]|jgi:L-aspartate oxidase|nr:L-aspartate oxidase [Planctomycetota bacterium]